MSTAGQLAQAAYEASINPRVSADRSLALAALAADAYRTEHKQGELSCRAPQPVSTP